MSPQVSKQFEFVVDEVPSVAIRNRRPLFKRFLTRWIDTKAYYITTSVDISCGKKPPTGFVDQRGQGEGGILRLTLLALAYFMEPFPVEWEEQRRHFGFSARSPSCPMIGVHL